MDLLITAASDNNFEVVRNIVDQGVTINSLNEALSCAIAYSYLDIAQYLINKGGKLDWGNNESLYWAAHNSEEEGIRFCLSNGVGINVENGMLLSMCVQTMHNDFIQWLIEEGADVNINRGQPLINAIMYKRLEIIELLLRNGANPKLRNNYALLNINQLFKITSIIDGKIEIIKNISCLLKKYK